MKKIRKKLNRLIEKYGLTHQKVIEYSNELNNAILPKQIKRLEKYKGIRNE
ncbi:aspartyl-phosphate phosphatase Spo0E family protein [Romboutsia timonensis]|uniref:aspartyl-phosphate phosphatase Spo0E family protein n=1 Tax=Romboutsia timonensis TaxID=1776391 RepID=UPI002A7FFF4B|nr:aspartyl-phosphate phosphatase Spo0E family protein [Romboutsia timonensis]MDY3960198.1 aspartyl-phosphate phosphatase Spo0E family protein [Romboutsia timonensis]